MVTTDPNAYINLLDVAKYYSVSASTVRAWIRTGKLSAPQDFLKLGGTYRFKIAVVDVALRRAFAEEPSNTPAPAEVATDPKAPVQLELNFNPDQDV